MRAIYINLDPYLAQIAAWIKAGKPGTTPTFDPLPLAVTVPFGQDVAIYCPGTHDGDGAYFDVGGEEMNAIGGGALDPTGTNIADNVSPGFSAYPAPADATQKYCVVAVSGNFVTGIVEIQADNVDVVITIPFTVLVRRETADGPVDLVDFTPPLTAAQVNTALGGTGAATNAPLTGVKLSGATNAPAPSASTIKSTLVAAGDGALAGVSLGGAYLRVSTADLTPTNPTYGVYGNEPFAPESTSGATFGIQESAEISAPLGNPSAS